MQDDTLRDDLADPSPGKGADLVAFDNVKNVREKINGYSAEEHLWTEANRWGLASGEFILHAKYDNDDLPFQYIRREVAPTSSQYAAAQYTFVKRTGGVPWAGRSSTYWVTSPLTSGFDVGEASIATAQKINGGALLASWLVALSPCVTDPNAIFSGKAYCAEFNFGNRWQDFGLSRDIRTGSWVGGLLLVPDVVKGPDGYTSSDGHFNASFGLIFARAKSGIATRRTWTLIHTDADAVPEGGLHWCARGGSTGNNLRPLALVETRDEWRNLLDFSSASLSGHALVLADSHSLKWGTKTQSRGTEPPTSGSWVVGSILWNNAPGAVRSVGWVCTGSGSPGTWRRFGAVEIRESVSVGSLNIPTMTVRKESHTVTGSALGDYVHVSSSIPSDDLMMTAIISSANTVTVTLFNPTAATVNRPSTTYNILVIKA